MNTNTKNSFSTPAAEQTKNNTTGWIGHLPGDNKHIVRGQTFVSNVEGDLLSIQVYPNIITDPGQVLMTVHSYDPQKKTWGPVLASSSLEFNKADSGKWVTFNVPGPHLDKGKSYGFKMETNEMIGVGEAAGSANQPVLDNGQEWKFTGSEKKDIYSYFSLAFKVGIRA